MGGGAATLWQKEREEKMMKRTLSQVYVLMVDPMHNLTGPSLQSHGREKKEGGSSRAGVRGGCWVRRSKPDTMAPRQRQSERRECWPRAVSPPGLVPEL